MGTVIGANGAAGHALFDGTTVKIGRDGLRGPTSGKGITGQEFPVSQITAAGFQPGTRMPGWIDFALGGSGGYDTTPRGALKRGMNSPPNVSFSRRQRPEFEALHPAAEQAATRYQTLPPNTVSSGHARDTAERPAQLDQLLRNGSLTEATYRRRRTQIINSL